MQTGECLDCFDLGLGLVRLVVAVEEGVITATADNDIRVWSKVAQRDTPALTVSSLVH